MFRAVGRRLALLNALVVIAVLATVGTATYLYLSQRIQDEVDSELASRATAVAQLWSASFGGVTAAAEDRERSAIAQRSSEDDHEESDENDDLAEELIRSGDTIAYGFDLDGKIVNDLRGVAIPGLPVSNSVGMALSGRATSETVTVEGDQIRLFTTPVLQEDEIIGAVQVGMGLSSSYEMLAFIRRATIGGLVLGALLALPSGLFLASRSMQPIRRAFERQQSFVADASHELRTPLTLIRAEAEFLLQTPDLPPDERRDGERHIVQEVDSMSNLVSNLLLLARSDGSTLPLDKAPLDLAILVHSVADRFAELARERGISLSVETSVPVIVPVDRRAIEQAVSVLVDNALTYTPAEGTVRITAEPTPGAVEIVVSDTGIGIEPADVDRIFDRFYRSDRARTRSTGGVGLGLSIAKSLVDAHGGTLHVRSQPGEGSVFTILLPS